MRLGFHRRLLATLVVTLAAVGFFQYRTLAHDTRERLVDEQRKELRADAHGVKEAYQNAPIANGDVPLNDVNRYLRDMEARSPGEDVMLVGESRYVVAAPSVLGIGTRAKAPKVLQSLRSGKAYTGPAGGDREGDMLFTAPVLLDESPSGAGTPRHLLVLRQRSEVIEGPLDDLRRQLILLLAAGLALAVPAFYLLGGRSLVRLHRAAVDRATRDGLTDLGNHRAFQEELKRAVTVTRRHDDDLTLALIDVDDFRFENDRFGNAHGDETLRAVARGLEAGRAGDSAFRIGGDEFALILPRTSEEEARPVLERLNEVLHFDPAMSATVSVGIAAYEERTLDPQTLRDEADAALFEARKREAVSLVSFREIEGRSEVVTAQKVRAVRWLLQEQAMSAAFQPILDLSDDRLLGFEALARPEPGLGLNGPAEAFDVAIAVGRAAELDDLCRRAIFAEVEALPEDALLFVNVAPQALDAEQLSGDALIRLAEAAGVSRERVVLEITERFSGRVDRVVAEAARLRTLGFKLALDDVGAGNSGLEMMRNLAVDFVKLDRRVVAAAMTDPGARAVMMSVATFTRETGAWVIAEGIEDAPMLEFVRELELEGHRIAVQGAQGYHLGRPGPLPVATKPTGGQTLGLVGAPLHGARA